MAKLTTDKICTTSSSCKNPNGSSTTAFGYDLINYTDPYIMIYQANDVADYDGKTKYGVLYNYCAATGGTVCDNTAMSADAAGSVCPAGWKMPGMDGNPTGSGATTDGSVKTYDNMLNAYGVTNSDAGFAKITSAPLDFVRSGYALSGSLNYRNASGYGFYWSSTKNTATYGTSYYLYVNRSYIYRDDSSGRYRGYSLRCVSS